MRGGAAFSRGNWGTREAVSCEDRESGEGRAARGMSLSDSAWCNSFRVSRVVRLGPRRPSGRLARWRHLNLWVIQTLSGYEARERSTGSADPLRSARLEVAVLAAARAKSLQSVAQRPDRRTKALLGSTSSTKDCLFDNNRFRFPCRNGAFGASASLQLAEDQVILAARGRRLVDAAGAGS